MPVTRWVAVAVVLAAIGCWALRRTQPTDPWLHRTDAETVERLPRSGSREAPEQAPVLPGVEPAVVDWPRHTPPVPDPLSFVPVHAVPPFLLPPPPVPGMVLPPVAAAVPGAAPPAAWLWDTAPVALAPRGIIPLSALAWEEPPPARATPAVRVAAAPPPSPPAEAAGGGGGPAPLSGGGDALERAILRGDGELAAALVRAGADPDIPLETPVAEELLPSGAPEEWLYYLRQERNLTPLMAAAAMGMEETVQALLEAGADRWAQTERHKTTAIWLAGRWQHVGIVQMLLEVPHLEEEQEMVLRVDLSDQRVVLEKRGEPVLTSPVSTGQRGFETPPGEYVVTNKHRVWHSTLYEDAPMPYFLRLNCGAMGLHAGQLPGYPASHGCIRLPHDKAKSFFAEVPVGTRVTIQP